jgi:hypothetical protein
MFSDSVPLMGIRDGSIGLGGLVLALASACDAPPARAASQAPPTDIALDVAYFVPVLGTWMTTSFSNSLRAELAKVDVVVVPAPTESTPVAVVTLGNWSDRIGFGRSITVALRSEGTLTPEGFVRVPDLDMTTLDVAAEYVAVLIANAVRPRPPDAVLDGADGSRSGTGDASDGHSDFHF